MKTLIQSYLDYVIGPVDCEIMLPDCPKQFWYYNPLRLTHVRIPSRLSACLDPVRVRVHIDVPTMIDVLFAQTTGPMDTCA